MVGFRGGLIESSEAATLKKCVLQNFAELTGKYLCQSLFFDKVSFYISVRVFFFNKVAGWGSGTCAFLTILRVF